jgi:hypothetical protein
VGRLEVAAAPIFRAYREGDEDAINRAFAGEFGIRRSLDEWAWLYPAETAGRAIVIAETGGEVVAHCAGVPLRLAVDGGEFDGVRLADVFGSSSQPDGSPRADRAEEAASVFVQTFGSGKRFQVLIGFSNRRDGDADAFPRCFGEPLVPPFFTYTRERPPMSPPRRFLYRAEAARDWEPRLDDLWRRARPDYPVAVVRDADRALRRFAGHPSVRYQRFLVFPRFSGRAVAFACYRCDGGRCRWVDLLWDHRHPGALDLLAHISARLVCQFDGAGEELGLAGDDVTRARLEALGFCRSGDPTRLRIVIRSFDEGLDTASLVQRLYLTMADTERV